MLTRSATTLLVLVLGCAAPASGQTAASRTQVATPGAAAEPEKEAVKEWAFSAMVSGYNVPGDRLYPQPEGQVRATYFPGPGRSHCRAAGSPARRR